MIGAALQQHLVGLAVILLGILHATSSPVVEFIDDFLNGQLTLHLIQFLSPLLQSIVAVVVNVALATHHLIVCSWQRDTG